MNDGMGTMFMVAAGPGELSAREFYPLLSGYAVVNDEKPEQRKPEDLRLVCDGVNADDDDFAFRGYVAYANELFGVSMLVHKNGDVEMLDDDPMGRIVRLH